MGRKALELKCPGCGRAFRNSERIAGKVVKCPCGQHLKPPPLPLPPPPPVPGSPEAAIDELLEEVLAEPADAGAEVKGPETSDAQASESSSPEPLTLSLFPAPRDPEPQRRLSPYWMVVGLGGVLLLSAFGVAVLVDALSGQPETVATEDPVPYASRPELPDVPGKTAIRSRGETWTVENHLEVIIWIVVVFLALALVVWIIYGKLT